jgi:predicted deacylase
MAAEMVQLDVSPPNLLEAKRTQLTCGYVEGVELSDGTSVRFPLMVASGARDGPTLTVTAGIHGMEIIGIEVIRRLLRETLNLGELRGRIIAVPGLNPLAVQQNANASTYDYVDMMEAFPGKISGSITQRLAAKIWPIFSMSNYVIDVHHIESPAIPFVIAWRGGTDNMKEQCLAMARSVGITVTQPSKDTLARRTNTQLRLLMEKGIPSLVIELPYARVCEDLSVEVGVRGIRNILRHVGMLGGRLEKQVGFPVLDDILVTMVQTATRGGLMLPLRRPGERIRKGEAVAKIVNFLGLEVETIMMPTDGYLISYLPSQETKFTGQAVTTGDWVTFIGFKES